MKYSLSCAEADIDQLDEYDNLSSAIVAPAILPPVNNTCEPVTSPLCFTLNLEEDMKYSLSCADADIDQFDPYFNSVSDIVAPAIFPPVNNTCEPVMSPCVVTLKLDEEI